MYKAKHYAEFYKFYRATDVTTLQAPEFFLYLLFRFTHVSCFILVTIVLFQIPCLTKFPSFMIACPTLMCFSCFSLSHVLKYRQFLERAGHLKKCWRVIRQMFGQSHSVFLPKPVLRRTKNIFLINRRLQC